jgi:hypothetical protein
MNFVEEFKRRCKRINERGLNKHLPLLHENPMTYKITRYRTDGPGVDIMWHLTESEAVKLIGWKFKTHIKHAEGNEVLIWYKIQLMET